MWQPKLDFGKLGKTSTLPSIFFHKISNVPSDQDLRFISCQKTGTSRSNTCELEENRGKICQNEKKKPTPTQNKKKNLEALLFTWGEDKGVCLEN